MVLFKLSFRANMIFDFVYFFFKEMGNDLKSMNKKLASDQRLGKSPSGHCISNYSQYILLVPHSDVLLRQLSCFCRLRPTAVPVV